ncbi:5-methyltetrahydropteroyltriglutamate--homocysteine S-methyltransferase [Miltoncostaea marina]|uniref:5-methyltetrahydropteroyltriglutamate-- homocysteine S-methyltransferase n=1 Tax=Miltoncostaea marina TaxID=2843215 RepID=UPI001C3CE8EE|nr:5-methyltetrahydropteroyltriglutamate--homocysteine S-methyltransferase [Miltoncostaea marina]
MARTAVLGLPRMGPDRELKFALESYWAGRIAEPELQETAAALRAASWRRAASAGIDVIPADHSLYDHVLDVAMALDAIPERFGGPGAGGLDVRFAMARGGPGARPLEMTKWFDTNYHYLVPELADGQRFRARPDHWVAQIDQARALGVAVRPVLLGPYSFVRLAKGLRRPLDALAALTPVYAELLAALADAGASEVQIDEPCLALDVADEERDAAAAAVAALAGVAPVCLTTYFAQPDAETVRRLAEAGVAELHLDLVRGPGALEPALAALADGGTRVSLGVLDGRNVWAADLDRALAPIDAAVAAVGDDRVTIATSCSLMHVPWEAARERAIPPEVRDWLAFAAERMDELATLARAVAAPDGRDALLEPSRARCAARRASPRANDPGVRARAAAVGVADHDRPATLERRRAVQRARLRLPELPTTTIGSFPQTDEIRAARRDLRAGRLDPARYEAFLRERVAEVVAAQEELGLDVLVHGEPERGDMVEYFGAQMGGFAFSDHGWVQSYGSRCVKPPILYGDVSRPAPMTVDWWRFAQSLTARPVKGMLTGPVTILQWSFVRDDQPRAETCRQIALAVQDEARDLEAAGAAVIQVDEAALREGLPLRAAEQDDYLRWAVDCFRLTTAPLRPETQVHTHMCYSEFNGIMEHVARLDADVVSIEASRSAMEVLDAFAEVDHPGDVGPGVYDIHSPRVPSRDEIEALLERAEARIGRDRLWVNPDCGLKTRRWEEAREALAGMVAAAARRRTAARA